MKKIVAAVIGTLLSSAALAESTYFGGAYGGVQVGHSQLETKHTDSDYWYYGFENAGMTKNSAVGGLRAGYDWVKGSSILGVIGEVSFGNQSSVREVTPPSESYEIGSRVKNFGSIRAKAGVVADKIAVFATGGVAFADINHKYAETDGSGQTFDAKGKNIGYVYGAGVAYAINAKSSIGFDISRYQFGARSHELIETDGSTAGSSFQMRDAMTTVNVSYNVRF